LGHDLYRFGFKPNNGFQPGVELLTYIDGNLSSSGVEDPNLLVTDFYLPWWGGARGSIKHTTYLSFSTLTAALAEHQKNLASAGVTGSAKRPDISAQLNKPLYSWHPEVNADIGSPCTRCRLYRAITFGAVDRLRDAENHAQGMAVANFGEVDIGMRRSSGFYELYEQVLKKEVELEQVPLGPGPTPASDSETGNTFRRSASGKKAKGKARGKVKAKEVSEMADCVRTDAERQLHELRAGHGFGQVDSKWTWGVDLDSQDIWEMVRGADKNLQLPHSGYDADLMTGKLRSWSPNPNPSDVEDQDEAGILFDELTHDQSIRELLPHEVPIAFAFPTLHYAAAGESHSGLQPPPISGSEYVADSDREQAIKRQKKQAMLDEMNSPDRPSTSGHPIIPKRSPPHRPWLGPPPHGYMRPPTRTPVVLAENVIDMREPSTPGEAGYNLDIMSEPEISPEAEPTSLPPNPDPIAFTAHGLDSDIIMDVASSNRSDRELGIRAEDTQTGIYGLVAPDLLDDSEEEIWVGNLGRDTVEWRMRDEDIQTRTYGLVGPDSPNNSDREMVGLVSPDTQSDSGGEIEVGNLGLDSVDSGMWAEADLDEDDSNARARARVQIPLPQVNPETGRYTAESFANIPDEWLD
jgi:hypothetical protein